MLTVWIVLGLLCAPVAAAPIVVLAIKRRKENAVLARLRAAGLDAGVMVWPAHADCRVPVDACGATVDCGGRLHQLVEYVARPPDDDDWRLMTTAVFCPLCGVLDRKVPWPETPALGRAFGRVTDVATLLAAVEFQARWNRAEPQSTDAR